MSRGVTMKTPERVAEARRLREQGLMWREIGAALGVAGRTAHTWVTDPDGSKLRARKDARGVPCIDCGKPTNGGARTDRPEPRCHACSVPVAADKNRIWTRAAIILAIQEWAAEYGEPPACPDWNGWAAASMGDDARADRYRTEVVGRYPSHMSAVKVFGSWNAAIEAAGFTPRPVGGGGGNEQRRRNMRATPTRP